MRRTRYGISQDGSRTVVLLHRGGAFIRGTEAVLLQSAQAFAARGYRLVVGRTNECLDSTLRAITPTPEILDFRFPELMIGGIGNNSLPISSYVKSFLRLNSLVKRCGARLIYCSGGLPCQIAIPVARLRGIPVICHFHHPATRRLNYLWLAKFSDKLLFPSVFVQRHWRPDPRDPGAVVYNGIDLSRFEPVRARAPNWKIKLGIPADAIVIGQVGALVANKRPEFLISAFSALRQRVARPLRLCLVGAGPLEEKLRKLVQERDLASEIILTGYVDDVLPYYQHVFDINVLVSREEGLGISVIEGSACGLPAVVSNCTGLPETIIEEKTGFLFNTNDVESLLQHMIRLIESPSLRASMGRAGRAFAEERFSSTSYSSNLMAAVADFL